MKHEIFWRDANTIQIYKLSVGAKPNDLERGYVRAELERKFGKQTFKPRPWGMVIRRGESDKVAPVFSRTSDTSLSGVQRIPHEAHSSNCKINVDGLVDVSKNMRVWSKIWLSLNNRLPGLDSVAPIACQHKTSACDQHDANLAIELIAKEKQYAE